jgi:uncharacterized protein YqgV (UPF0045/DUF77 family)
MRPSAKNSPFKCPVCGENQANAINTLRGLKKHMTGTHGGYTQEQLTTAAGSLRESGAAAAELFEDAAKSMPESAESYRVETAEEPGRGGTRTPSAAKVNKQIAANFNQVKQSLAEKIPLMIGQFIYGKIGKTEAVTKEKVAPITESIQTVLNALGVDIQIEPMNTAIKSRLWLIFIPLGAIVITFFGELLAMTRLISKDELDEANEEIAEKIEKEKDQPVA